MTVKIVTDSVSDIPSAVAASLGVTVVPLQIIYNSRTFRDGVDLTTEEFYTSLERLAALPTTSTPPPYVFTEVYERLASQADGILVITIGSKLSVTGQVAFQAVEAMRQKCRVEVVVSETAMMAEGLLAIAAAKAAAAGATLDDLVAITQRNMRRASIRLAFDTLKYLERGGRIGKAQALMGSMLGINPVLGIKNGEVFPFGRERSRAKALDHLYHFASGFSKIEELAVEDATTPDEAETLTVRLGIIFPRERIYRAKVSPVIGANVGPRVIGVAVLGDR
jgi:DegV family protein with EDD domain